MKESKIFLLLKGMTKKDKRRFKDFLKSRFFNKSDLSIMLLEFLIKNLELPKLTEEKIFKKLYSDEKFNRGKIKNQMSRLVKLLEEFFIIEEALSDEIQKKQLLIRAFDRRKKYKFFESEISKLLEEIENIKNKDDYEYLALQQLNHLYYFHQDTKKFRNNEKYIFDADKNLTKYYYLKKLKYASEIKNRKQIYTERNYYKVVDKIIDQIHEETKQYDNILFEIYYKIFCLNKGNNSIKTFIELKDLLFNNLNSLDTKTKRTVLLYLINFAIRKNNEGNVDFQNKQLELYKKGLSKGILYVGNRINDITFTNIAILGSTLKDFSFTKTFIEKYKMLLRDEIRSFAENVAWIYYFFHKNNFKKVREIFPSVNSPQLEYDHRIKGLYLRTCYELWVGEEDEDKKNENYEHFDSFLKSYKIYLSRDEKLNKKRNLAYLNFVEFLGRIVTIKKCKEETQSPKIKKLKTDLEQIEQIALKSWLLDKIEEIENSKKKVRHLK